MSKIILKSILILALVCLVASVVGLTTFVTVAKAGCASCGAEENWDPQDKLDQIGNPEMQQGVDQYYTAAAARSTNSQFNGGSLNESARNSSAINNTAPASELGVSLNNIGASPNPANPGSPVKITATLGAVDNMTAYVLINNSFGTQVGNVPLDQTPGGEYVGTWTAGIATGIYKVSLVASSQGQSKTFDDVLQIAVEESGNATSTSTTTSTSSSGKTTNYLKLG